MTIDVDYPLLHASAAEWRAAAENLDGAVQRLGLVTGAGLPGMVAAAVDRFAVAWGTEIRGLAEHAREGSDAFVLTGRDFGLGDRLQADRFRALLPDGAR